MSNSTENSNLEDEFTIVRHRGRPRRVPISEIVARGSADALRESQQFNKSACQRRLQAADEDLKTSDLYASIKASLWEGLSTLNQFRIKEIVCFGLGKFGESLTSRFQLALLQELRATYAAHTKIYDPVFDQNEIEMLTEMGFEVMPENIECKYPIEHLDALTLFYLPHCGHELTNNVLWANWSLKLSNCVIISNSFARITEETPARLLNVDAPFISAISPHALELAVINSFRYHQVFNNTAIHMFPLDKLSLLPTEFWGDAPEPQALRKER